MKQIKRAYVLVEVEIEKDVNDMTDKVAGRVYTLDGVWNTTAKLLTDSESFAIASALVDADRKAQEGMLEAHRRRDRGVAGMVAA